MGDRRATGGCRGMKVKPLTAKAVRSLEESRELLAVVTGPNGDVHDLFVVGADISTAALEDMRARLARQGLSVTLAPPTRCDRNQDLQTAVEEILREHEGDDFSVTWRRV